MLVAPDSVDALAAAMDRELADHVASAARAAELREVVQRKFTVAAMTAEVLDFYRSALPPGT